MIKGKENIRPWGRYDILGVDVNYKVKEIKVNPGQRLSYQYHNSRDEYWVIVKGTAEVTIDSKVHYLKSGDMITIKRSQKHRVKNTSSDTLSFIEIQLGEYFGEDDIIRLEDDYKRL